ncbi:hypothetical protein [Chryseobacterium sp. GP-SGM7]|uniref:hypothetical protein n=1 Tax=Chryseobacterium sp. GP-SGM7 TaxID=3411323 RepID=UPI003B958735
MQKLSDFIKNSKSPKVLFHISYDIIGASKTKPENPLLYILTVLKKIGANDVERHSESTLIVNFDSPPITIFDTFSKKVSPYFYYSISQIDKMPNENFILKNNSNDDLNKSVKQIFSDII